MKFVAGKVLTRIFHELSTPSADVTPNQGLSSVLRPEGVYTNDFLARRCVFERYTLFPDDVSSHEEKYQELKDQRFSIVDCRLLIVDLRSKKKGHHPGSLIGSLRRFDTRNEDRDELIAFFYDVCHFSRLTQRFAFDDFQRKSINLSSSSAGVSILSFSFTNQQSTIDNHQSNVAASLISAL